MKSKDGSTLRRETIFAPASGAGRAAISVVRISGASCLASLNAIAPGPPLQDRVATLRVLRDPESGEALDRALVIKFSAPRSFTSEEMAELHITGGRAVLAGVLTALGKVRGLRPADPGEFTLRAFENGKLDLSEVEGLADLVQAETAAQRRQALHIAGGALSREADAIRGLLLRAMSMIEAQLDFSDVEDADILSISAAREVARQANLQICGILETARSGERLRDGLNVVIAGPPNAGKSTLMNALARRDVSIVSAVPGTTRDLIEVALDLRDFPVNLIDTAGIRETDDPIEQLGIDRARRRAESADLTLWLTESGCERAHLPTGVGPTLFVRSKSDNVPIPEDMSDQSDRCIWISAKSGAGISQLLDEIGRFAAEQFGGAAPSLISTERHRVAFFDAREALSRALEPELEAVEFIAEELRFAARALERISGRVEPEEVLGEIFSRLCVGK